MRLVCVVGPTATGKTALAVDLCRRWGAELVGADASQVYRGLDIGTGKAMPAELEGVRHHLIDVVDPDAPFDAAAYLRLADAAIADIAARGRRVVVCGGTGLYLRALLHGLCAAPPISDEVRAALQARLEAGDVRTLHRELAAVDPEAAAAIQPNDRQRIERALGVWLTTGQPLSTWQSAHGFGEQRYGACLIGLDLPREALNARIEARVRAMFRAGFVDEVRRLVAAGHEPALRSMSALGYRYVAQHLAGELSEAEALEQTIIATRRYAKRQRTWFRKVEGVRWFTPPLAAAEQDAVVAPFWGEAGP